MNIALREKWTIERFLAWEDQQEGRHEFDGVRITEATGGSRDHQRIVGNLVRPSIRRYIILKQTRAAATVLVRGGEAWVEAAADTELSLPELDMTLSLAAVYRGVRFG
jgi:Uma2 family endonuclease